MSDHTKGALLAAVGITIASPDALLIRLVSAPAFEVTIWRGTVSALVVLFWLAVSERGAIVRTFLAIGRVGLLASFLYPATAVCFILAVKNTSVANVLVIVGAEPLCAALLAALIFREKVGLKMWLLGAVIAVGLAIVFWGSLSRDTTFGDLMAFVAMFCVALRYVLFRATRNVDMLPTVVVGGLITTVVLLPFSDPFAVSQRDIGFLLIMGMVLLPVAQMMLVMAPRYIPAPEIALIVLLEAILAPIWVWLALGEVPPRETVFGGVLIFGTMVVHFLPFLRRAKQ